MFTIRKATSDDCKLINELANQVFPATYKEILSTEQLDYMMEWGMMIAVCGFLIMAIGSIGLPTPDALADSGIEKDALVSPNWLISTYLVLTFAELFLSPMGISFVSKVAPPKYKGMMMGGWFAATAIGNYLVAIIGYLWGGMQLWMVWSVLIVCCLLAALFIFSIMKKLEKVA